ncbi:hypothetical protein [Gordonia sp. (in: high G+C Gram-positive bacteria)]|uniref:hypothetical protein n=1 Tax=Gordonia sp. (in: high G+C Gram-positive bacteria) TaxID=84139 RepID=UPI003F96516A
MILGMRAPPEIADLLQRQDGVVSRKQALECGCTAADVRRSLRRRDWATIYSGVYVDHTGPLTWRQRAWAAVLDAYSAALCHTSVLPGLGDTIHIAIEADRKVTSRPGVEVHRRTGLQAYVAWNMCPPRLRIHEVVLDIAASARSETEAIAVLADAVNARITAVPQLRQALAARARMPRRARVVAVLTDIAGGTCSILEHRYLTGVERPHGLPVPVRQAPTSFGRKGFRDLDYPDWGTVVELDGWRFHDTAADRDRDLERDLDAAVGERRLTLHLGFGQVAGRPCETAWKIATALTANGWPGPFVRCPNCPPA